MNNKFALLFLMLLFSRNPVEAKTLRYSTAPKYLSKYIDTQVRNIDAALAVSEDSTRSIKVNTSSSSQKGFYFSRFKLRLEPFVKFSVGIAKLKIFPIVELDWRRKVPKGWTEYHP